MREISKDEFNEKMIAKGNIFESFAPSEINKVLSLFELDNIRFIGSKNRVQQFSDTTVVDFDNKHNNLPYPDGAYIPLAKFIIRYRYSDRYQNSYLTLRGAKTVDEWYYISVDGYKSLVTPKECDGYYECDQFDELYGVMKKYYDDICFNGVRLID